MADEAFDHLLHQFLFSSNSPPLSPPHNINVEEILLPPPHPIPAHSTPSFLSPLNLNSANSSTLANDNHTDHDHVNFMNYLEEVAETNVIDIEDLLKPKSVITTVNSLKIRRCPASKNHNLSEQRRRRRINENMKTLQKQVPNSSKTDKASMLEEAIRYIKKLEDQVQVLALTMHRLNCPPLRFPEGYFQPQLPLTSETSMDLSGGSMMMMSTTSTNMMTSPTLLCNINNMMPSTQENYMLMNSSNHEVPYPSYYDNNRTPTSFGLESHIPAPEILFQLSPQGIVISEEILQDEIDNAIHSIQDLALTGLESAGSTATQYNDAVETKGYGESSGAMMGNCDTNGSTTI